MLTIASAITALHSRTTARRVATGRLTTPAALGLCILASASAPAQQVAWSQHGANTPGPRYEHPMAFDSARGITVLVGGSTGGNVASSQTWEWSSASGGFWTQRTFPVSSFPWLDHPTPRYGHTLVYDSLHHVSVLFAGTSGQPDFSLLPDTWQYDGTAWQLMSPNGAPTGRLDHAMAYDAQRHVSVLFGGRVGTVYNGETWEYTAVTPGVWVQKSLASPSARARHAMAYDENRHLVVLFGGQTSNSAYSGETWEYNGTSWTQRFLSGPTPRIDASMTYDSARGVVVLFGGLDSLLSFYNNETWEYNGIAWTQRVISGPPARTKQAMAFDSTNHQVVMFGGSASGVFSDTWELGLPLPPACIADVDDGSGTGTRDGGVTIEDLLFYLQLFAAGDVHADVDDGTGTGTHDGGVTIEDLLFYLQRFAAGC